MVNKLRKRRIKRRGSALIMALAVMTLLAVAGSSYIGSSTQAVRLTVRNVHDIQTTHLCEAGVQTVLRSLWRPFKIDQNFENLDTVCYGASPEQPEGAIAGTIPNVGAFSSGVIGYSQPPNDPYTRIVRVRAVGWIDRNGNGALDDGEPRKTIDVNSTFQLARSNVFDYTYFINNYGWMDGFGPNDLIVNGDMRANGDMAFLNGSPTINGAIYAAANDKLVPPANGLINLAPVKWANSTYKSNNATRPSVRQVYDPAVHGAKGSEAYEMWRDFVFDTDATLINNRLSGAAMVDSRGTQGWTRTSLSSPTTYNMLDTTPSEEAIMPDLSDLNYYKTLSQTYVDTKQFYGDGTPNPGYNQGAYVEVWDQTLNGGQGAYKRISTNGVVNGSAALIGTSSKPIKIHGPVTFTQDAVIKGFVEGQGTIYTGRNVHIVGSIQYKNPPDFRGTNFQNVENNVEKKDILALAARGSVIMGNPKTFAFPYPLKYMTPPFTKGRYDEEGNYIPPFDATQKDETGFKKYQSVMGDTYLNSIATGINRIDAILYTNFVGGGNIGTGGGGVEFNGTIISKDEAIVTWSVPIRMNYDHRIRERTISKKPLIDIKLPRSPVLLRSTWQDRGFSAG